MLGAGGEDPGDGVAILLGLVDPVCEVFHPGMGVLTRAVVPVTRVIKAKLHAIQHVGFTDHIVMLAGLPWVARIIGDQHAVNLRQLVGLRPAGLTGVKSPQLKARRAVLLVSQTAFLNVFGLAVFQIRPVQRAAGVDNMAKIPPQHHIIDAVAVFRIALLDHLQPDQHSADIQRRIAYFTRLVLVVHLLSAHGVIGFVGQFVTE